MCLTLCSYFLLSILILCTYTPQNTIRGNFPFAATILDEIIEHHGKQNKSDGQGQILDDLTHLGHLEEKIQGNSPFPVLINS